MTLKRWRQQVPKKLPYVSTKLHGFIFPKTITLILTAVRVSWVTDNKMAPSTQTPPPLQYFLSSALNNNEKN